ncbi:MAG TPA: hypothetical protein PK079_05140 [Leptospiraceae bacterium]|nr:hypothetical protein [Leptospiraceae bacterium]HMW06256.1 hypothetical protein [Leptospiraceae bacterium]HMX33183.1 hypothetical protein [Leptospiraceae bacterium]HMY31718.1 hypothetical protein [Leptospiraceae bacterium]HMZ64511.1 hypothetical protein [Leptospiraceae bacterium]
MITGQRILRFHGILLCITGSLLYMATIVGKLYNLGMFAFLAGNPVASIGFQEAYALISILGVSIYLGSNLNDRFHLHILAAFIHVFLIYINISHWSFYTKLNIQIAGYISTSAHFLLMTLESYFAMFTIKIQKGDLRC